MASLNVETTNKKYKSKNTYSTDAIKELERAVMSCFLWENSFYESGNDVAERIKNLIKKCKPDELKVLVLQAKHDMNLRHIPLFILAEMAKNKGLTKDLNKTITETITRPDDCTELIALYWKDEKKSLTNQLKKGLANALKKFNQFQLAKYQNKGDIKLIDIFNLCHPTPKDKEQEKLWKTFVKKGLPTPDTWETRLSAEGNKKEIWVEFLKEKKLGSLALLRNLRNMTEKGVEQKLISNAIKEANFSKVLPFQFVAAARYAPTLESVLEEKMFEGIKEWGKLKGKTKLLIDVSGSMDQDLSAKSEMKRIDAACALAMFCREVCEDVEIYSFSENLCQIPNRHGFSLRDAIVNSQQHSSTYLGTSVNHLNQNPSDRLIVFTDEQSHDAVPDPKFKRAYMINVAGYQKSVATSKWVSISGFSERVVDFIKMTEEVGSL